MMISPVLVCQGLQQAFIEPGGPLFSASATMRRATCEAILRNARRSGWTVLHSFLDSDAVRAAGEATIQGLTPLPSEPYSWQAGHSAFGSPAFERALFPYHLSPVFLISFAGLGPVSATLLAGLDRHFAMHVVTDAVADIGSHGIEERERIRSIETLARSCDCAITSSELSTLSPAPMPIAPVPHLLSQTGR